MTAIKKCIGILLLSFVIFALVGCSTDNGGGSQTYSINLRGNGGTPISQSVDVVYGDSMPYASKPTRYGYTFLGYYDSMFVVSGTKYYNSDMSSARKWDKKSDSTLYALWKLN
ncbi:MAG TPA: InlB B-repeat-containing protein [Acholeplasmataceae bacterium]|jgi:hypothetical protein|nr:InlB B-repeat-containing protein [Acholeplasmataceae bacterium]